MINAVDTEKSKALREIIQLNPFDAVTIIQQHENHFSVEMINAKAAQLFNERFLDGMDAEKFFHTIHWFQIYPLVLSPNGEVNYITLQSAKQLAIHVQPIAHSSERLFSVVMRLVSNDVATAFEEHLETAKHVYFVEQYVDPVISLDRTGTIIYTNIAATRKLQSTSAIILGQSIFELIEKDYLTRFRPLFYNTLEGYPMGMPQCLLKNKLFSEEPVYLKTFPTYWNGKIIGAHVIVKNVDGLFQDGDTYPYMAYQDELTGLLNRRALNEKWSAFLEGQPELNSALMLVDLDRFKKFNESLGKKKADGMLAIVSNRFKRLRSEFCEIFRYNGDEFVFLLRYVAREEVERLARNILELLKEPLVVEDQDYFVTASIGIATSVSGQISELDTLLHKADQALFYVKNHGRNHFRFYSKEMSQAFPNEALLEAHLRRAIEFGELSLHLQPQIDLFTETIDSFEALIRWNNRKFGLVPPSQFIPLAESSGLILDIGDWVLERVCQYQQEWRRKGYRPVRVAVNISPKQFKQDDFVHKVECILKRYNVKPELIELEITESSMTNVNETTATLTGLKRLGVYVSVDDFGTGYSSLSYLKKYPIDIIKIDQSFIADIEKDKKNEAIVKAIILLSHNLGLEVVAEGVEQKHQERFLYENQCKRVQGYLYNKPLPVEQIIEQYFVG
ncbi:sensor domain-containing protein [Lysinibacillus sp. 54212]|uniref:sensor domain-containing protein n=1 Tax=Lysinibacillus sp. 54212 TaxID=3119829 RepID=UPI002FC95CF2